MKVYLERCLYSLNKTLTLLALISFALFFQACSADDFATNGNGQPYEGLTIDDTVERVPDDVDPNLDVQNGSVVQNRFETHYLCFPESNTYSYIQSIRFGIRPNGQSVVLVHFGGSKGLNMDWDNSLDEYHIHRAIDSYVELRDIELEGPLADGSQLEIEYRSVDGIDFTEYFTCSAQ